MQSNEIQLITHFNNLQRRASKGQKKAIAEAAARALGCSEQTYYRKCKELGLASARKRRADAGTSVLSEDELRLLAGVLHASSTQRGQRLPVRTAIDMLVANGQIKTRADERTASRQLRRRNLHPDHLALPSACVQVAAAHVNHVWQIDSTTGIYYYMPGGRLRFMPEDQFYKNKLHNVAKAASDLVTRYSCVDVASHMGKARHFLGGESAENLLEFLIWCIWKSGNNPMHGAPFILVTDPGPANKSQLMTNFCRNTGIRLIHHAPGAARVTGSVEKFHDLIGMHFERRLRFQNPAEVNLDRLDGWLDDWALHFCTTRIHSRTKRSRAEVYMGIQPEHLRVPASMEVLREAAVSARETRRVANDRTVSFRGRTYDLSLVPGVVAGLKATLRVNVFRDPQVDVLQMDHKTGEETWHIVDPVVVNEFGYREGAPVWGETFRSARNSAVDNNRSELLKDAYQVDGTRPSIEGAQRARKAHAQAYAGIVDPMADVKAAALPTYLPRRSTPLHVSAREAAPRRLNIVAAAARLRDIMGADYPPTMYSYLAQQYADGVAEDQLDGIAASLRTSPPSHPSGATSLPDRRAANQAGEAQAQAEAVSSAVQPLARLQDGDARQRREWQAAVRAEREAKLNSNEATIRQDFERLIADAHSQHDKERLRSQLATAIERNRALIDDLSYWWRTGT